MSVREDDRDPGSRPGLQADQTRDQLQGQWIRASLAGDAAALERLVSSIQRNVYNIAVRFLWSPPDAEDATQEILIKVITGLKTFAFRSAFDTWVYRVAANYLLNLQRRGPAEALTFEVGGYHLEQGLTHADYLGADSNLLAEEVKIGCTTSMLACLTRPQRLAYIFGEILGFDSVIGADALEISSDTFRKHLSNARKRIRTFMGSYCGLYDPRNACRCRRQINYDLQIQRVNLSTLCFADKATIAARTEEVALLLDAAAIFRSHPDYQTPETLADAMRKVIATGRYQVLG